MTEELCRSIGNVSVVSQNSWSDDLDDCPDTGVGFATNHIHIRHR